MIINRKNIFDKKIIVVITIILIIGKLFGFLREILLSYFFGTSYLIDVYIISIAIPSILFGFLPALSVGYISLYYKISQDKINLFTSNVLVISILISLCCIILAKLFLDDIVLFIANGFDTNKIYLTTRYMNVTIWLILFYTPIQILISFLNCKSYYVYSNISNLLLSSVQCIIIAFSASISIYMLPYGILLSFILQFLYLLIISLYKGFHPVFTELLFSDIYILFRISLPISISYIIFDINGFVDKYLASSLSTGSISSLHYAFTLSSLFYFISTSAIMTIFYPRISELVKKQCIDEVEYYFVKLTYYVAIYLIPLTLLCISLSRNIIYLVFQRGAFDNTSLSMTIYPFICYVVSLPIISMKDLIVKVMYAYEDTVIPMLYSLLCILINIVMSLLFIDIFGHIGLALATSLAIFISFPLYFVYIIKLFKNKHFLPISFYLKIFIANLPMVLLVNYLNFSLEFPLHNSFFYELLKTSFIIFIGVITVFLTMKAFKFNFLTKFIDFEK